MFNNNNIFRSLVEKTQAIIFIFKEKQLFYVNPMAEMLTGYSITELKSNFCLYPQFNINSKKIDKSLSQEVKILTKANKECWLEYWCESLDSERQFFTLITAINITKYKQQTETEIDPDSYLRLKPFGSNKKDDMPMLPSNHELKQVLDFIDAHYHESISLNDVATAFNYSPAYLTDLTKRQTGKTINRWIIERRLAAVEVLLKESNWSVEKIAETVGYFNLCHFFRQFRQYYGTTPTNWRCAEKKKLACITGKE
jgi:PAS domain S-box-containing protein